MAPIASTVKDAYKVSDFEINMVANLYLIMFLPGLALCTYSFDKLGVRNAVLIGAILQGVGAALKYFINMSGFWIVLLGQSLAAIAQPTFISSPALVSTWWFNDSERSIAITIGGTSNAIGNAIGFFFPTLFVDPNESDFEVSRKQVSYSLLTQGIIGVTLALISVFTFIDKPKSPPSSNAVVSRETNLLGSYYKLITNFEFIKLMIVFTMYYNNINVISTLIDLFVERYGFDTTDSGFFGAINVIGGIIGCFIFGILIKKPEMYKPFIVVFGIVWTLSLVLLMFLLRTENKIIVSLAFAITGFFSFPTLIVWYGFSSEITMPINEATSGGLFQLPLQYFSFGFTNLWTEIIYKILKLN